MTQPKASYEVLERLAEALDEYDRKYRTFINWDPTILPHLRAYQEAIRPPLRSRAEVDAEIANLIRDYHRHTTRPGHKDEPNWDSFSTGEKNDLNKLCREPTSGPCGEES